jgi:PilZ domain
MQGNEAKGADERRKEPRFAMRPGTRVSCHLGSLKLGRDLAKEALDLSDIGIRLLVSEPLSRGEVVEVGLVSGGGEKIHRLGVVVWSEEQPQNLWMAGIVLSRGLGSETLRTFCQLPD